MDNVSQAPTAPRTTAATRANAKRKGAGFPEIGMLTPIIRAVKLTAKKAVVPSFAAIPWKTGELRWKTKAAKDAASKTAQRLFRTYAEDIPTNAPQ